MAFELAHSITNYHLIVQPSDAALNPPESYFYVQDGLIISCGVLYAFCYFFYALRTYKDKTVAGPVEYMATTMAYEIYYAFATTSTTLEFACFIIWFLFDVTFVAVVLASAYPRTRRPTVIGRLVLSTAAGVAFLQWLCRLFPDEREQVTAFWVGVVLQFPISIGSVYLLVARGDTKGHSLEIWITRCLGCWTAYGLFFWRYWNVPQNWSYVGSAWSVGLIGATLAAEAVYPFVYVWVWKAENRRNEVVGKKTR